MLRVSLLGNLGADPEVRFTQKGTQIASFRVAVNQVRTGPDGERQENTEWFRIRVGNRQTDYVTRLSKGARVLVIGRLDIGHYQGRDGETRTSFDVWADDVQSMSPRVMSDSEGMLEPDADTPEPAVAGVSSIGGSASPAPRATSNGSRSRSSGRTEPAPSSEPTREDLEDLPF